MGLRAEHQILSIFHWTRSTESLFDSLFLVQNMSEKVVQFSEEIIKRQIKELVRGK